MAVLAVGLARPEGLQVLHQTATARVTAPCSSNSNRRHWAWFQGRRDQVQQHGLQGLLLGGTPLVLLLLQSVLVVLVVLSTTLVPLSNMV